MKLPFLVFLIILYFVHSYQVKAQMNDEEYNEMETYETDSTSRLYLNEIRGLHEADEEFRFEETNEDTHEYYLNQGYDISESEL